MSRFVLVTGERAAGPPLPPLARAADAAAGAFRALWETRFAVPCRWKTAAQVGDADLKDSNLILFGGPEENELTARVLPKLPVKFAEGGVELGGRRYAGANLGVKLCHPNPLNPQRYVVLMAGATPESYADLHVRFGNWFDWIPFDFRNHFDFAVFDDRTTGRAPETFLVWGFFDERWRLRPAATFEGLENLRRAVLPRVLPTLSRQSLTQAEKPPATLHLDELAPLRAEVAKEYLERNRSLAGGPLEIGGRTWRRGLCGRFPMALVFPCAGYRRLRAVAGIEWDGRTNLILARQQYETATVTVQADGRTVFQSAPLRWFMAPLELDVPLGEAKEVSLQVSGGRPWLNGSFVWAEARLERE
jgi:hypothetical protein